MRRAAPVLVVVAIAYLAGLASDVFLNGDECLSSLYGQEGDSIENGLTFLPPRSKCQVNGETVGYGSPEVFWAMFVATLVAGAALLGLRRRLAQAPIVLLAYLAAFAVIFL